MLTSRRISGIWRLFHFWGAHVVALLNVPVRCLVRVGCYRWLLTVLTFVFAGGSAFAQSGSTSSSDVFVGQCAPNPGYSSWSMDGPAPIAFSSCRDCSGLGVTSTFYSTLRMRAGVYQTYNDADGTTNEDFYACPYGGVWSTYDTDGDGYTNGTDIAPFDKTKGAPAVDTDGDGLTDDKDNCPSVVNADQADVDGDKIGDLCDSSDGGASGGWDDPAGDKDGDGILNGPDNCVDVPNTSQADEDGDGIGDLCDSSDGGATGSWSECSVYAAKNGTLGQAMDATGKDLAKTKLVSSLGSVLNVSASAGSCPVWDATIWHDVTISFDFQCSTPAQNMWSIAGYVILACASFIAVRWAFL